MLLDVKKNHIFGFTLFYCISKHLFEYIVRTIQVTKDTNNASLEKNTCTSY